MFYYCQDENVAGLWNSDMVPEEALMGGGMELCYVFRERAREITVDSWWMARHRITRAGF
jgi:hypothetical protein